MTANPHLERGRALAAAHVAVALFGAAGVLGRLSSLSPLGIVAARTTIGAVGLGIAARLVAARIPRDRRTLVQLAGQGIVLAAHWITFFQAIKVSSVAVGLLGFAAYPMFVCFLEPVLFAERLERRHVLTALAVCAGLAIVAGEPSDQGNTLAGIAWGALSGLLFAVLSLWNRASTRRLDPVAIALVQNVAAAACTLPFGLAHPEPVTAADLAILAILGLVCTGGAHALFIASLRTLTARIASVIAGLEPVYGVALAWALLGEAPSMRVMVGGAILCASAVFAAGGERAPQ